VAGWEPTGIAHDFRARATSFVLRRRRGGVCDGPQVGPSWCRLGARDTGRPPGDPSSGGRWRARGRGHVGAQLGRLSTTLSVARSHIR
jgi:hypothetical protein